MDKISTSQLVLHAFHSWCRASCDPSRAFRPEKNRATLQNRLIELDWILFGWVTTTTLSVISKLRQTEIRDAQMPGCKLVIAKLSREKVWRQSVLTSTPSNLDPTRKRFTTSSGMLTTMPAK